MVVFSFALSEVLATAKASEGHYVNDPTIDGVHADVQLEEDLAFWGRSLSTSFNLGEETVSVEKNQKSSVLVCEIRIPLMTSIDLIFY